MEEMGMSYPLRITSATTGLTGMPAVPVFAHQRQDPPKGSLKQALYAGPDGRQFKSCNGFLVAMADDRAGSRAYLGLLNRASALTADHHCAPRYSRCSQS